MTAKEFLEVVKQAENYNPAMTVIIEKYGQMLLDESQASDKDKEILRLKGLIGKMYWKLFQHHLAEPDNFQLFKTENNL